jgi:hypothetical protein
MATSLWLARGFIGSALQGAYVQPPCQVKNPVLSGEEAGVVGYLMTVVVDLATANVSVAP